MSDDLTKEQQEELEKLQKEIVDEAKKVVDNCNSPLSTSKCAKSFIDFIFTLTLPTL